MSQPPDPQEEHSRIDWRFPAREGEPSIVLGSFGLKTQITLYYRTLGLGSFEVKQIMEVLYRRWERKFGPLPEPRSWDWFDQDNRLNIAVDRSKDEDHPWEYTPFNVGKYMVSGLTDNVKLGLIVRFGDEEINQIPGGQHLFPRDHIVRSLENDVYRGADERLLENRLNLTAQVKEEDEARHAEQAKNAPPPFSRAEIEKQTNAMKIAAAKSLASRKPGN